MDLSLYIVHEDTAQFLSLQPFAWEAREFVRKHLVGKEVQFVVDYKVPKSGREYGYVWVSNGGEMENVSDLLLTAGLVEVRQGGARPSE